jgi:steroid delta-isomerase-like uncharacterized protein
MSVEDNNAAVQRMGEEVFNQGNLDVLDELVAQDVVDHDPTPGQASGREGIKPFVSTLRTAFPDLQLAVENMVAEGDYVAFNYTINGTHQGEFMGIEPTGKQVSVRAMEMVRIAGGQMVDRWGNTDQLGLLDQLGALPPIGQE